MNAFLKTIVLAYGGHYLAYIADNIEIRFGMYIFTSNENKN